MSQDRRSSRILAMQALCQWEVQRDESSSSLAEFLAVQPALADATACAAELVRRFWRIKGEVDTRIASVLAKWDLARISPVERNIMRVAVVELLNRDVPAAVILDEAIEIGRQFGGAQSPLFINGVLDAVFKRMQASREEDQR